MKKNVLKIGVLSLFVAGALTATLTGSVNNVSALQKANFDDKLDVSVSDIFYTSTGKYKILFPNDNII
ncbi:hypothetical protein OAR07_01880 [Flavobacteriaceae bacterium]|nr:hypothetical protein [Flavobacteriaceae bacterium]